MTNPDFIKGAAYVSDDCEVLIFSDSGYGFFSKEGASYPVGNAPPGLRLIWAPGDGVAVDEDGFRSVVYHASASREAAAEAPSS